MGADYSEFTIEGLLEKVKAYDPNANFDLIREANECGLRTHGIKKYLEKRPLDQHLLGMAYILADLKLDDGTIIAGLIHDWMIEDPEKKEVIKDKFGAEVAELCEEYANVMEIGRKNLGKIDDDILGRAILAASKDIRTVFITIISILDLLQWVGSHPEKERQIIAENAVKVYLPLCHKLGLDDIERQIGEMCFKILSPDEYTAIKTKVPEKMSEREGQINEIIDEVGGLLKKANIEAVIYGRPKSLYSIYRKIKKGSKFSDINDLLGIRIICGTDTQCYEILGILHSAYQSIPKYFDDYIVTPKGNKYRSIHSTVAWKSRPLEVQIRTEEMHREAEAGMAAHWIYKQYKKDRYFDKKLSWARQLIKWQEKSKDSLDLIKSIRMDVGKSCIFVLTPKKELIILSEDSTPVDFAFAVHSDLGYRCHSAKVNGKLVALNYKLDNTDVVEITPSANIQVKRQWLGFVRSEKARRKIRQNLDIKVFTAKKKKVSAKKSAENVKIAQCCRPLPKDEVIACRTTKRKIVVHKKDCENIKNADPASLKKVDWWGETKDDYSVKIRIKAVDRAELIRDLLEVFSESDISINKTVAKRFADDTVSCVFNVRVENMEILEKITAGLKEIPSVHRVERI